MRIQISERSWHLRLARRIRGRHYEPRDLCSYFWGGLVLSLVMIVGLALGALTVVTFVCLLLWMMAQDIARHPGVYLLALVFAGFAVGIGFLAYLLTKGAIALAHRSRRPKPPKAPNLVVAYLKAKKRRLCPLVEVVP